MTGCSAPNCNSHSKKGAMFHRFPADPERRRVWSINCGRKDWTPTQNDRLCSMHFEDSEYEQHRMDGKLKLRPFAIPTIFNNQASSEVESLETEVWLKVVPIPETVYITPVDHGESEDSNKGCAQCQTYLKEIQKLKKEIKRLKSEVGKKTKNNLRKKSL